MRMPLRIDVAAWLRPRLPATLFGRLALLLLVFVLVSHVLALTVMFELRPHPDAAFARRAPPLPTLGLLLDIGLRLAALTCAAWIAASWLSRPIKRLAAAAHELGRSVGLDQAVRAERAPLPEEGPRECREAARGFNRMRAQIHQQLDERDRFVAAVSHDLRTPLTRLRLRTEGLHDAAQRAQFAQDIGEMDQMITATLDYLRGAAAAEAVVRLDVHALVASIAEDQQACGHDVVARGSAAPLPARASALRRCIGNLVDNAVRYGGSAQIHLIDAGHALRIEVHDRGPGIAAAELERVLEPFYRLETSRNREHGGVGLGLSIAHDIARQHGGSLTLRNARRGGLVAVVELPR